MYRRSDSADAQARRALKRAQLQVGTEHVLLGMIAEEHEKPGLFGPAVLLASAEEALTSMRSPRSSFSAGQELPFSRNAQSLFEAAYEVCLTHAAICALCELARTVTCLRAP